MSDCYISTGGKKSIGGMFSCTPLTIYLVITIISVLIFYSYKAIKGSFPDISTLSCTCCSILISACIIQVLCFTNPIAAWALMFVLSGLIICGTCCMVS